MHVKTDKPPSPWMKKTNGNGQVHLPGPGHPAKAREEKNQWKRTIPPTGPRTADQAPAHPPPGVPTTPPPHPTHSYRPQTSGPSLEIRPIARKSGTPHQNLQKPAPPARTSG